MNHYDQKNRKLFKTIKNNKKIIFNGMYDRNSGKNTKTVKFDFKKADIIIFEGLYIIKNLKIKNIIKILITENVYISLIRKIKRIRDKKISIQNLISEFTNLHLSSFQKYLKQYVFNIHLEVKENIFVLSTSNKKQQIAEINKFLKKHLSYKN